MTSTLKLFLTALLLAALVSCGGGGGGSTTIQPGSPAFYWAGAKQAWQTGDFVRTADNLSKLTQSDNEYRNRAEAWLMIVTSGLTQGYMEYAEAFDVGAKANREKALEFRRQASTARSQAKAVALQFVEAVHHYSDKVKDPKLSFEFSYPTGTLADVPGLLKVAKGMMPLASDADAAERGALQKGVVKSVCRAVGAPDSAKALDLFKQSPVEVSRETFVFGIAQGLNDQAMLFGPKQLDEPQRLKLLTGEALDLLKQVPASKETKDLDAKLQKTIKLVK